MGEGVDYSDQTKTGTIPVCTDDYTKEFPIVGFAKSRLFYRERQAK